MDNKKTLGEKRIRTSFNPSDNSTVQQIKNKAAELLDYLNENLIDDVESDQYTDEKKRLKELALLKIEEAAMWAVKAATA